MRRAASALRPALKLLFEQAEGDGGLGGSARLRDHHDAKLLVLEEILQLVEIVLADVLAGEKHVAAAAVTLFAEHREAVAEGLDDGFSAEVAAADADGDHILAVVAQLLGGGLYVGHEALRGLGGEVDPAEEV